MDSSKILSTRLSNSGHVSNYQMDLLSHQLINIFLASNIAAIFILIVLWSYADQKVLLIWLCTIIIISLSRVLLVHLYQKKLHDDALLMPWYVMSILAGLGWGLLAVLYSDEWPALQQFAVVSTLFIMALGAIPAYATNLLLYKLALLTIMGPIIGVFVFTEGQHYLTYAAGLFCLVALLYMIAWRYHQSVIKQVDELAALQQDYLELKRSHDAISLTLEKRILMKKYPELFLPG